MWNLQANPTSVVREFMTTDPKPAEKSANQGLFDPGVEDAHWSDIAVEDDFGFGIRSSKEVN